MVVRSRPLATIIASRWGASFTRARHVYSAMVGPAIISRLAVWHAPSRTKDAKEDIARKVEVIQTSCLRVEAGA